MRIVYDRQALEGGTRSESIRAVALQLGVGIETLRIWCNRYGPAEPLTAGVPFHVAPGEIPWEESGESEPCLLTSKTLAGRERDALVWAVSGGEGPTESSNHEVLDGEAARALVQEIARAASRPEAQPGEEPPRHPHRDELSDS